MFISDLLKISDPVITFDHIMEEIEITKYLKVNGCVRGDLSSRPKEKKQPLRTASLVVCVETFPRDPKEKRLRNCIISESFFGCGGGT